MVELLSRAEIIEALQKRDVKAECEVCRHSDGWSLPDGELSKIVGLFNPRSDGGYIAPGGIAPAIVLVCNHCGHIRMFSEIFLQRLLKTGSVNG